MDEDRARRTQKPPPPSPEADGTVEIEPLLAGTAVEWWSVGFGPLDYARTMRRAIPGATAMALGVQIILTSFFASILGLRRR